MDEKETVYPLVTNSSQGRLYSIKELVYILLSLLTLYFKIADI